MDIPRSGASPQEKVQLEFVQTGTCLKRSHSKMKHAAITKATLFFHHKFSVRHTLNCSLAALIPLRKFVLSNHQQRRQHAELSKPVQNNRTEDIRADEVVQLAMRWTDAWGKLAISQKRFIKAYLPTDSSKIWDCFSCKLYMEIAGNL